MTFFLPSAPASRPVDPAPQRTPSVLEAVAAGWTEQQVTSGAWNAYGRREAELLTDLHQRLGPYRPSARTPRDEWERTGDWRPIRRALLQAAADAASDDPGAYADLPLSEGAFDAAVKKSLQAELDDAQAVTSMAGPWGTVGAFLGAAGRAGSDPINLALMPLGAGGGLGRVLLAETGLGMLGEAAALPGQFRMAERLDLPDPDALAQIALGGAAAGVIGTGLTAAGRGAAYLLGRRAQLRDSRPGNASSADHEARLDAAEAALRAGEAPDAAAPVETPDEFARLARRIVQIESGGRRDARNPNSTATGPGQFIESTWIDMIARHRPDLAAGKSRKEVLALRGDDEISLEMTAAYASDNAALLRREGFQPGEADLYLAHFLGPDGARRALLADPEAPVSSVMSADQIAANGPKQGADGTWTGGLTYAGRPLQHWRVKDLRRWSETKIGAAADPGAGYRPATSRAYTGVGQVTTEQGTRIDVEYEIVDLDSLILASGNRQPRDRSRAAPTAKVIDRAARLDPAQLLPSPLASTGAPIVGRDNIVDSGNGRVMSILHAAEAYPDRYDAYVEALRGQFEVPDGVTRPVLIARRTTDLEPEALQRFVREANVDVVERMSAAEQARIDADQLSPEILGLYDPAAGGVGAAANRAFVRRALGAVPSSARGQLLDRDGGLTPLGALRMRSALFARSFDAPDLIARQSEEGGAEIKALIDAMTDAAATWATLRDDAAAGLVRPDFDITAELVDAVRLIAEARQRARANGQSVRAALDDLLAQDDLLGGGVSPVTARLVDVAYAGGRARAGEDVSQALADYVREARQAGAAEGGLLDAVAPVTPLDVLDTIIAGLNRRAEDGAPPARTQQAGRAEDAPGLDLPPIDARGVDDALWTDGAMSPGARAADDQAEAELRQLTAGSPPPAPVLDGDAARIAETNRQLREMSDAQPFEDLNRLFELAPAAQTELSDLGDGIAARLGVKFKNPGIKARETTAEKLDRKSYASVKHLTDIARGGFVVDTVAQADEIAAAFRAAGLDLVDEGWTIKAGTGFVDRKLMVRTSSGLVAEVQIWTAPMLDAKTSRGQDLYTQSRSASDPAERRRLEQEQAALYADALERSDPALSEMFGIAKAPNSGNAARNAASPEMSDAEAPTSSRSTSTQAPPGASSASARSADSTTGRPSQLPNFMGDTSTAGAASDVASRAPEVNAAAAELLEAGDFDVTVDGQTGRASEVLRDLEDDAEFVAELNLCGVGGVRNA